MQKKRLIFRWEKKVGSWEISLRPRFHESWFSHWFLFVGSWVFVETDPCAFKNRSSGYQKIFHVSVLIITSRNPHFTDQSKNSSLSPIIPSHPVPGWFLSSRARWSDQGIKFCFDCILKFLIWYVWKARHNCKKCT